MIVIEKRSPNNFFVQDMLSSVYGLVNKNLLVFEARQKLADIKTLKNEVERFEFKNITRSANSKTNGVLKDAEHETPICQVKEWNEYRMNEHYHPDYEHLLQKSEPPMLSKIGKHVIPIAKDWRQHWLLFLLASLLVFSVIGITILNYMWLVSKKGEASPEIHENPSNMPAMLSTVLPMLDVSATNQYCNSNLYEGIFIDEGSPITETKILPADTCSCDRGTMWFYNFTKKPIIHYELFTTHGDPDHCEDFCMCDSGNGCYRPKNISNYKAVFLYHCGKSCQFFSTFEPPFLDDYANEIKTSGDKYVQVDSIGCNGCDSLKRRRTCNKQSIIDNLRITPSGTGAEITWSVTSNFSIVDLRVYHYNLNTLDDSNMKPIFDQEDSLSPTYVPNLIPDINYTLTVYFYPDRRSHVKPKKWSIAFNRDFRTGLQFK
uniref:Fibronectin type-III domain-containing protein n=2 Tax=Acrobeloides nanus TaxID=290746 RepID=A0A914DRT8_9BILA